MKALDAVERALVSTEAIVRATEPGMLERTLRAQFASSSIDIR